MQVMNLFSPDYLFSKKSWAFYFQFGLVFFGVAGAGLASNSLAPL